MDAFHLALLDQTGGEWSDTEEQPLVPLPKVDADTAFADERKGWGGSVSP